MPSAIAAPPPAPAKTSPAPAPPKPQDKPTQPDPPSGHEPAPQNYLADDMAEFEQMDSAGMEPAPEPPKRGADGKFQKPPEPPKKPQDAPEPEKGTETPTEPEKTVEEPKPGTMRALGKAYDEKVKLINHELQPKIQSLESKVKEYESKLDQLSKSQPDVKPFQEKLAAIEKENQQLREAIRFSDYRQSPDFVEKYEKPYNEAWGKALAELGQISVSSSDGSVRKFNENDLLSLANASDDKADEFIEQAFPRLITQQRVLGHLNEIRRLADAQDKALKEAKKSAGEFHTNQTNAVKKANESFALAYQGANTELTTKYPKWFAPDDTDPKGNEILKKGYEYADSVLSANGNLTPEQKAGRLAVLRAKAANHDRLVARLKARDAQLAELEAKLKGYEESEPPTQGEAQPTGTTMLDLLAQDEAELRKLDR